MTRYLVLTLSTRYVSATVSIRSDVVSALLGGVIVAWFLLLGSWSGLLIWFLFFRKGPSDAKDDGAHGDRRADLPQLRPGE